MRSTTTTVVALLLLAVPLRAQPPADTAVILARVGDEVRRLGAAHGEAIWPGFRPDTVPLIFALPGRGTLLVGWSGALPAGYAPVSGIPRAAWKDEGALGAASTGTSIDGRPAAQIRVRTLRATELVPTAVHEAFHVFQKSAQRPDRRFGRGESPMLVSRYPIFDARNEAEVSLEGRLLADALRARSSADVRSRVHEFLAVREARQRRLGAELAEFEAMAELNEGLAEYALVSALGWMAADAEATDSARAAARRDLASHDGRLDSLTADVAQSMRLRFYATGPALARLLDRLAGASWKQRLTSEDLSLQDALADASGYRQREAALRSAASRRHDASRLAREAAAGVERLKALRLRQVDSLLSRPGIRLVIDASAMAGGDVGNCGFDPQNLLRVSSAIEVHTRWFRPCNTRDTFGEFNTPVVHDETAGTITAVIGDEAAVTLRIGAAERRLADGERLTSATSIRVEAPLATYQAGKADVERRGNEIRLTLRP